MTAKLHEALQNLHQELSATPELDPRSQELLQTVLKDIQHTLEAKLPHEPDAVAKLETAALSFEMRHPTLATMVQQVVDVLRKAGI